MNFWVDMYRGGMLNLLVCPILEPVDRFFDIVIFVNIAFLNPYIKG